MTDFDYREALDEKVSNTVVAWLSDVENGRTSAGEALVALRAAWDFTAGLVQEDTKWMIDAAIPILKQRAEEGEDMEFLRGDIMLRVQRYESEKIRVTVINNKTAKRSVQVKEYDTLPDREDALRSFCASLERKGYRKVE